MKLMDFIQQIQRSAGDPKGDEHLLGTILQYINEETQAIVSDFPERATFTWSTTSTSYFHSIDFTEFPVVLVTEVMIAGTGLDKKPWKDLRERVGNVI